MSDVARTAGVADQTLYNYFPTKPDLVLDLADEMLERSRRVVAERDADETPAEALRDLVHHDIDLFSRADPDLGRGEFPAQSVRSDVLRRYALAFRHDQTDGDRRSHRRDGSRSWPRLVAFTHAAVLVAVMQSVTDTIGEAILAGADLRPLARRLHHDADVALNDASHNFDSTTARFATGR